MRGDIDITATVIKRYYEQHGYLLDPHTAMGVHVAEQHLQDDAPMIRLATAYPAKFPQAIADAVGADFARHPVLEAIKHAPTRCVEQPNDVEAIRSYIENNATKV